MPSTTLFQSESESEGEVEDVFSDSLQSLYGYTPITHSSAGSVFRYTLAEEHLRLQSLAHNVTPQSPNEGEPSDKTLSSSIIVVTPTTESRNWSLHASSIWTSSLFLADHLQDLHIDQHIQAAKKRGQDKLRVLELGAGAGLPSILIAKCFHGVDIVASDYPDDELIRTLQANVDKNGVARMCRVVPHAWGSDPSVFGRQIGGSEGAQAEYLMDVIIAADTLWNSEMHALFLKSLQMLLRRSQDARIYVIGALHTGRYTLQAFINSVEGCGLELEDIVERNVSGDGKRAWNTDRAELEGDQGKERRQWVVWMKIKWKDCVQSS